MDVYDYLKLRREEAQKALLEELIKWTLAENKYIQSERKNMRKKDLLERLNKTNQELDRLKSRVRFIESSLTLVKNGGYATKEQLRCAEKGHNWVFDKIIDNSRCLVGTQTSGYVWAYAGGGFYERKYQFKCSKCGLTIIYTKDELSVNERKALKELGILE